GYCPVHHPSSGAKQHRLHAECGIGLVSSLPAQRLGSLASTVPPDAGFRPQPLRSAFPSGNHDRDDARMNGYQDKRSAPLLLLSGDAADHGISEWRLRAPEPTERVTYGVRANPSRPVTRVAPEWADTEWDRTGFMLRALQLKYPQVAASHASAAVLYGLPLPGDCKDGQLHVSTADRNLRIRRPGVVLHRVADFQWTNVLGHQLMTAPSLFLQFAASLDLLSLVMVGDAMIGSWHGPRLCTLPQLTAHFSSRKSVKNRRGVEDALALIRPDVDSPQGDRAEAVDHVGRSARARNPPPDLLPAVEHNDSAGSRLCGCTVGDRVRKRFPPYRQAAVEYGHRPRERA